MEPIEKFKLILVEATRLQIESVEDVLKEVFGERHRTLINTKYLRGRLQMPLHKFEKFCTLLGVRNEFSKKGIGHPFIKIESNVYLTQKSSLVSLKNTSRTQNVAASQSVGGLKNSRIDPIGKKEIQFVVTGGSMENYFFDGDTLKCRLIENIEEVKNGEVYVFSIRGYDALMLKQAQVIKRKHGVKNVAHQIKLISFNDEYNKPFFVDVENIDQIFKVVLMQRKY
jgi:hypothetical protein